MANLTRREADIAVRPIPEPPETLVGRRIAQIGHAVYGSQAYLSRHGGKDPARLEWLGLDDTLAATVIGRWMRENVPQAQIGLRVDALPALRDAACSGIGVALLPCYLGDGDERLRRVAALADPGVRSALWLLTHSDLRHTARVRAVMDVLAAGLICEQVLFEGRRQARAKLRAPRRDRQT
jgi:DNA-binding transcriptional LysR family regulator